MKYKHITDQNFLKQLLRKYVFMYFQSFHCFALNPCSVIAANTLHYQSIIEHGCLEYRDLIHLFAVSEHAINWKKKKKCSSYQSSPSTLLKGTSNLQPKWEISHASQSHLLFPLLPFQLDMTFCCPLKVSDILQHILHSVFMSYTKH